MTNREGASDKLVPFSPLLIRMCWRIMKTEKLSVGKKLTTNNIGCRIDLRLCLLIRAMEKKLFISDEPIEELTEDAFGHTAFVSTLYKCIKGSEHKMNIGLLGKWGVGKTSILKLLFKHVKENDKNIKTFLFDAWKYPRGNLCQELVLQLNREFQVYREDELEREIYCIQEEESTPVERTLKERLLGIWRQFSISISITIFLVIIFVLLTLLGLIPQTIYQSLLFIVILPIIVDLVIKMNASVSRMGRITRLPAKFDPARIEGKFRQIVDKIMGQPKVNKLVIAIDNLDRCSSEDAIEMLEAIKALMEHEKCVYLVSCNDEALTKDLVSIRKYTVSDASEFLRKFFQTSVVIPSLLSADLERFASNLLARLEIPYTEQILQVIVNAFMENPRKIKQFLNNLTTQYLLVQEREKIGVFGSGDITGNDGFLAKILVIRQEFPLFYEELDYREELLEEVETYFMGTGQAPVYKGDKRSDKADVFKNNPGLEQFLKSTRLITVEDITPFLKLNRETFTSVIPNAQEFKLQVNRGNVEYVEDSLRKLEQENEKVGYVREIIKLVNHELRVGHYDWVFNGVDILVKIHHQVPASIKQEVARGVGHFLTLAGVREHLGKFDYNLVFPVLKDVKANYRNDILHQYASALTQDNIDMNIIDQFIKHYDIMPAIAIEKLNNTLIAAYGKNKENVIMVIRRIKGNPEASNKLISSDLVEKIENSINESTTQENQQVVDLYFELKGHSSTSTRFTFLKRLLSTISADKNTVYDEKKKFGLQNLIRLDSSDITDDGINELYATLDEFTGLIDPTNDKLQFVEASFKFFSIFSDSQQEQYLQKRVPPLVNSGDAAILKKIVELAIKYKIQLLGYEQLLLGFTNRVKNNLPDIELIKMIIQNTPKQSRDKVKEMLIHLINDPQPPHHDMGLESSRHLNDELTATQISEISEACLQKSISAPTQQKRKYITPILELFGKNTVQFKRRFADYTAEFIANDEIEVSNLGIECYNTIKDSIEEEKRKTIIIRIIRVIEQKAAQDMIDKDTERLLNLVIAEQGMLDPSDLERLIDTLHTLLNEAKPKEIQLFGIRHLARISKFHQRKKIVVGTLRAYLGSSDEEIKEQARLALESITGGELPDNSQAK